MRLSERLSINRQEARKPQKPGSQETSPFGKGGNPFVFICD
jgi:hypothetical protein